METWDGGAVDGGAAEGGCARAISDENAQALYAAIKDVRGPDGCTLEQVRTEKEVMRVEWRKGGVPAPLIEIRPRACAQGTTVSGPEFSMSAPEATVAQCPNAVEKMKALIASEDFGGAVEAGGSASWLGQYGNLAGAAAILLLVVVAFLIPRRRKA